jgi:hypothetical protein
MGTRRGGDTVKGGYYWNLERWDATFVEGPAGELPGSPREIYRGIPTVALLFAAPIMGALFVMFLPFIGIALLLQHIARAAVEAAGEAIENVMRLRTSGPFRRFTTRGRPLPLNAARSTARDNPGCQTAVSRPTSDHDPRAHNSRQRPSRQ